jgi:hypothetical protein
MAVQEGEIAILTLLAGLDLGRLMKSQNPGFPTSPIMMWQQHPNTPTQASFFANLPITRFHQQLDGLCSPSQISMPCDAEESGV